MAIMNDVSDSDDDDSSMDRNSPQHLGLEEQGMEGSLNPLDMSIVLHSDTQMMNASSVRSSSREKIIRSSELSTGETPVSIRDVEREISELRVSVKKFAISSGRRCQKPDGYEASANLSVKLHHNRDQEFPDPEEIEQFFRRALKRLTKLGMALNKQQMVLFERQAEIIQLRMSIVQALMEFEAESKLIKAELTRVMDGDVDERLNSSMPNIPDTAECRVTGESLHASWPLLNTTTDLMPTSTRSSEERISHEIHTILEELPGLGDSSSVSSGQKPTSDDDSSFSVKEGSRDVISRNVAPSNKFEMEPGGGRITFRSKLIGGAAALPSVEDSMAKRKVKLQDFKSNQPSSPESVKTSSVLEQALHCTQKADKLD